MLTLLYPLAALAALRGLWSPCGLSMLSALNPVSERARRNRYWVTACWYVGGAVAGGALLGAACALVAWVVRRSELPGVATWTVVLIAAAVATLSDARVGGWSLPVHARQVDERWLARYRRWIYAAGYGVQIGTGFATYIMTGAVYLTAVVAMASGNPPAALAAGLTFGSVRGLGILLTATARTPERLRSLLAGVSGWSGASALAALLGCLGAAVDAAAHLGGARGAVAVGVVSTLVAGSRARALVRPRAQPVAR
jgi:hypothetical protein